MERSAYESSQITYNQAQYASRDTNHDGFQKELVGDIQSSRSYGHAQSNLLGALGDGNEHDVHNAYASHKQGESCRHDEDDGDGVHC